MNTNNSGILTVVLKALLDGKTINRKDYNNGSATDNATYKHFY